MKTFIYSAKGMIRQIVAESQLLQPGEFLLLQETLSGECQINKVNQITAWIDETGTVINPSHFILLGSHPLRAKEVARILQDQEYFNYLTDEK